MSNRHMRSRWSKPEARKFKTNNRLPEYPQRASLEELHPVIRNDEGPLPSKLSPPSTPKTNHEDTGRAETNNPTNQNDKQNKNEWGIWNRPQGEMMELPAVPKCAMSNPSNWRV
ncbi:hypothetical protein R1flu_010475 [Riccia fluitans]|uniref:Uncharacterized protein n=1 Tax=Riccia fluitans TaxID=41844 RepID=A0ABD1Z5Z4_9MARC